MNQQDLYQQAKAERDAERLAAEAKAKGLFTKQDVHDIVASAVSDFMNMLMAADPFVVGTGSYGNELNSIGYQFQITRNIVPDEIDVYYWHDRIK